MNYNEFEDLVTKLYNSDNSRKNYLNTIPQDINQFVFGNSYQATTEDMLEYVLRILLKDMYDDVMWFLYGLSDNIKSYPNKDEPNIITSVGGRYWIHNLETYLEYAKIELFDNGLRDDV